MSHTAILTIHMGEDRKMIYPPISAVHLIRLLNMLYALTEQACPHKFIEQVQPNGDIMILLPQEPWVEDLKFILDTGEDLGVVTDEEASLITVLSRSPADSEMSVRTKGVLRAARFQYYWQIVQLSESELRRHLVNTHSPALRNSLGRIINEVMIELRSMTPPLDLDMTLSEHLRVRLPRPTPDPMT